MTVTVEVVRAYGKIYNQKTGEWQGFVLSKKGIKYLGKAEK